MAFGERLLLCVGAEIMLTGITDAWRPLLAPRGLPQ